MLTQWRREGGQSKVDYSSKLLVTNESTRWGGGSTKNESLMDAPLTEF